MIASQIIRLCLFILPAILISGCNNDSDDFIFIAEGISMNPSEPRIGLELSGTDLFYCEEIMEGTRWDKPNYTYYEAQIDPKYLCYFKSEILSRFQEVDQSRYVVDGTEYSLIYKFGNQSDSLNFYSAFLHKTQYQMIDSLLRLGNCEMRKIPFHNFPDGLLMQTLPKPPAAPVPHPSHSEK